MDEVLFFGEDDFDILDIDGYELKPSSFFNKLPEIAKPLVKNANKILSEVEKMLYSAPALVYLKRFFRQFFLQNNGKQLLKEC